MSITRPPSHVSGDAGERLFASSIPDAWVPYKQSPDYAIDYLVLVPEVHLVTGVRFAAQVKTTTKHPRVDGAARVEVEVPHLEYWLDQEVSPVFLVACDLGDRQLYYVDVDILQPALPDKWRQQKTVTVSVPVPNSVSNHSQFLNDIRIAWSRRMGPHAAIARRQRELQGVDPRFLVRITATETGERHELIAKEKIQTTFQVRGPKRKEKVDMLFRGYRVEFAPGEMAFDGMPLLARFTELGGSMEMGQRTEATASLVATEGSDEVKIANVPISIIRAPHALRLESCLPQSPLSFSVESSGRDESGRYSRANDTFDLVPSKWAGQYVNSLFLFGPLHAFFARCFGGALVRVVVHLTGQDICVAEQRVSKGAFTPIFELLELLRMAREVSVHANINPMLPPKLLFQEEEEIRRLHALIFDGEYRSPGSAWTMSVTGTWSRGTFARAAGDVELTIRDPVPEELSFLGKQVPVAIRQVRLTKASLAKQKRTSSGYTRYTFASKSGEFIQRSDRFDAQAVNVP